MSIFKCKMCGGNIEFAEGATVGTCEYCGTKQTLPKTSDDVIANLFNRANNLRLKCEFDKAEQVYEKIVQEDDGEAEAHWGIVLCKYGIEYVEDPNTKKRIPTCHRTLFDAVISDPDYLAAIDYSDAEQQVIYESEARAIDRIQKDILAIVKNEKPFDVFLCYKETDADGKRTVDSTIANDIYYQLTQEGFKVFYAAITLEDKLGQEYEPYIFAALNSSKVMLVIGTKPEYFSAVWVKNEWSRYLKLMKTDRSKLLIPCYRDMDAYDLPEEFAHLQAQDMSKIGFINDVVRGIKKVIKPEVSKAEEKPATVTAGANANIAPLLERAFLFLEDGNWQEADDYCEKVLDQDPKNAQAYLGKLMAELRVQRPEDLKDVDMPFDKSNNFQKAMRYGSAELKAALENYIKHINERNEIDLKTGIYNDAVNAMKTASGKIDFKAAAEKFKSISGFADADEMVQKCMDRAAFYRAQEEAQQREIEKTADAMAKAVEERMCVVMAGQTLQQQLAQHRALLSELQTISQSFEGKTAELQELQTENQNAAKQIQELQGERSKLGLFARKRKKEIHAEIEKRVNIQNATAQKSKKIAAQLRGFETKRALDKKISQIEDSITELENKLNQPRLVSYERAFRLYHTRSDLKNCFDSKYPNLKAALECFIFGRYRQSTSGSPTPIEWIVLDEKDGRALLVSKYALDCEPYRYGSRNETWETCFLRQWLNETFICSAFSAAEQSQIQSSSFTTACSNNTTDKVFLLNGDEAKKYFSSNEARQCVPTEYAIAQGAYTSSRNSVDGKATCWWWLRSPGLIFHFATFVYDDGSVSYLGSNNSSNQYAVRPAMWISLD